MMAGDVSVGRGCSAKSETLIATEYVRLSQSVLPKESRRSHMTPNRSTISYQSSMCYGDAHCFFGGRDADKSGIPAAPRDGLTNSRINENPHERTCAPSFKGTSTPMLRRK